MQDRFYLNNLRVVFYCHARKFVLACDQNPDNDSAEQWMFWKVNAGDRSTNE